MNNRTLIRRQATDRPEQVRLFASPQTWIEGEALRQLYAASALEGVQRVAGFPDLHPGKSGPVGAAFVTQGLIYPQLIGGDIGCGMTWLKTNLVRRDINLSHWADLRFDLENAWEGDVRGALSIAAVESKECDGALGTLGGGNHFAELQRVEEVFDAKAFRAFGLGRQQLTVLVHSGSRGMGESILRDFVWQHGDGGVDPESPAGAIYLRQHDQAASWARVNRQVLAQRFTQALGAKAELLWDGCHNSIRSQQSPTGTVWIHRKGAVIADSQPVVIPGSCGSLSYLVKPLGDGQARAWSLAHGAGRKWSRSAGRVRMRARFAAAELLETSWGSRVICEERSLLYEEAPAAYKNIETVITDLVEAGIASVIATFRPVLTYKTRKLRR